MAWWNETGALSGWAGCLFGAVMLLGFWVAVIAALMALLGSQPKIRQGAEAAQGRRRARPAETAVLGGTTTAPPRS